MKSKWIAIVFNIQIDYRFILSQVAVCSQLQRHNDHGSSDYSLAVIHYSRPSDGDLYPCSPSLVILLAYLSPEILHWMYNVSL